MLTITASLGWLFLVFWTTFADGVHAHARNAQERLFRLHNPFDYNTALIDAAFSLDTAEVSSIFACSRRCRRNARCRSINYKQQSKGGLCQLNSKSFRQLAYTTPPAEVKGFEYYEVRDDGKISLIFWY